MRHGLKRAALAASLLSVVALALGSTFGRGGAHVARAAGAQPRTAMSSTPHYLSVRHATTASGSSGPSPIPYQGGQVLVTPSIYISF